MADDEIARLLREVEAELARDVPGTTAARSAPTPATVPGKPAAAASQPRAGMGDRLRAATPRGVVVGAVWGLAVGTAFSIVPVVDGLSGALAAFVTGFGVSVAGRVRRR